ncbi:MAG: hypothetical protein U0797_09050 [Gemmataceae bacterium]
MNRATCWSKASSIWAHKVQFGNGGNDFAQYGNINAIAAARRRRRPPGRRQLAGRLLRGPGNDVLFGFGSNDELFGEGNHDELAGDGNDLWTAAVTASWIA